MSIQAGRAPANSTHGGAAHGQLWDAIRAKGRRVEVIAVGAELDMVLRADRMLQLWAAAEPGKVIEGLTIKQEISAIREALNSGDQEFMSQYGGMQGAADRYMELLKLPEAAELPKGVSIDDYSTYRATRFSEPVLREADLGRFFVLQTTAYFLLQGQKGGCNMKKREGGTTQHS